MAYPTGVNFVPLSSVGIQPINETSTAQNHPLGMEVKAKDTTYGEGTFKYLKGVASTAAGDLCAYESDSGTTVRAVAGAGTSAGPMGVAMSANVASQYGWYQVEGSGPVNTATVADNAALFLTSTAGQVDDLLSTGELVDGLRAKAATSSGFTTCQINRPNVTGVGYLYCTLSAAAEAGDAIVVTGAVKDSTGTAVVSAKQVVVRTLAVTANKGDITVVSGTEKKTVNPATGENVSWIATTAAGAFSVSVANDVAEETLITVMVEGGMTAALLLTFA